ncbi:hypothetical protein P3102_29555 [Amycolatopsis sp. QT-25]|uniref:hypothetical protein n=1 Tax=Amycolatopsis sp. QT-25 TaxID=3034022 RepID=UPI0023EBE0F7|nr:hypothetical protein [Amycolatopsis sp. QT-25]WET78177.1 hypothetical protein P3102_29555 [Amycolatopsis sp. QT-25]
MRYDEAPPWSRRSQETWWSLYGRAVRYFSVIGLFVLLPLVILFFVDRTEAIERLRIILVGGGIVLATLVPAVWYYNAQDGADTLEVVIVKNTDEHGQGGSRRS